MDATQVGELFQGPNGTLCKTLTGVSLVGKTDAIGAAFQREFMSPGNLAFPDGFNGNGLLDRLLDQVLQRFGGSTGSVLFVYVVYFLEGGLVTVEVLEMLAEFLCDFKQQIDSYGKVGGVNQWGVVFLKAGKNILSDVVPAGGAYYDALKMAGQKPVVVSESSGSGKIHADGLGGQGW